MKTATLSLGNQHVSGWYAKQPHAFATRDEMGKRVAIGLAIAIALYAIVLIAYFISLNQQEILPVAPTRKPIVINPQEIVPPTPPDVRQDSKPVETVSTKDVAAGIIENIKSDKDLTNQTARDAVKMAAAMAIESGLNEALNAIDKAFGDGPPEATAGSKNQGMLASLDGKMGGLVGLNIGGSQSGLGLGDFINTFGPGSNNGGGLTDDAKRGTHGGGSERGTGLSRSGVRIAVRAQKLVTKEDLRPAAEIASVLEKYQPALEALYTQFSSAISNAKATVQFVIAPDGAVIKSEVVSKSFSNATFERELAKRMKQMRFSAIKVNANQTVTAPFNFSEESNN
jgi:TonB family protein